MTYRRRGRGRRPAFTLIEMLVVIAIIAIMVSLTSAAVMRALVKIPEATTKAELSEFESKLGQAKSQYFNNIPVLPSHLRLREDNNYTAPAGPNQAALQADYNRTKQFLQGAFGRHVTDATLPGGQANTIDWNGDGSIATGDLVLEGEQCLVFWLGGIPSQPGGAGTAIAMTGFCTSNSANPAQAGGQRTRAFEFQTARLKMFTAAGSAAAFPVYVDPWKNGSATVWTMATANTVGMPYAFFASYNTEGNGSYDLFPPTSDCPSLLTPTATAIQPYTDPTGKWVNAGSFQILSAGRDGKWGAGGVYNSSSGTTDANGKDDWSNFAPRGLGAAAN